MLSGKSKWKRAAGDIQPVHRGVPWCCSRSVVTLEYGGVRLRNLVTIYVLT